MLEIRVPSKFIMKTGTLFRESQWKACNETYPLCPSMTTLLYGNLRGLNAVVSYDLSFSRPFVISSSDRDLVVDAYFYAPP